MGEILSVSLVSSKRDHITEAVFFGERFRISRIGTDGNFDRATQLLKELDGQVDAFGLGGIDIYLVAGRKKYKIRDAQKLVKAAKKTPIVDGSGLKNTLEREVIGYLMFIEKIPFFRKKVLMTSAVDRFGMAEALHEAGCQMIFGDLLFGLKIPIVIRSMKTFRIVAKLLLPIVTNLLFLFKSTFLPEEKPKPIFPLIRLTTIGLIPNSD